MSLHDTSGHVYGQVSTLYVASGLGSPLPLPAGEKFPPPSGFTGRVGLRPSRNQIACWIARDPLANIGLRLFGGLVGLDVDQRDGKSGWGSIERIAEKHGPLPPAWRSTARGTDSLSGIYLFETGSAAGMRDRYLGGDVEVIRAGHRYMVVAPSLHPNGQRYEWVAPNGLATDRIPHADDMSELPGEWSKHLTGMCGCFRESRRDRIARIRRAQATNRMPRSKRELGAVNLIAKLSDDLAGMHPDTVRNNTLNSSAYYLYQHLVVSEGSATHGQVTEAMAAAARSSGLNENEIYRTLASAWEAAERTVTR